MTAPLANPRVGPQLTPSPRALQKALLQSAERAQRLAQAFGKVVPAEKSKKQRSASVHQPAPHNQPTDFGTLVLKKQALMSIGKMSGIASADRGKAKAAIT